MSNAGEMPGIKKMIIKNSGFLAFQSEIAVEYGLNEAIILQSFHYWTKLNAKDNRNLNLNRIRK